MAALFGRRRPIRIAGHAALALASLACCLSAEALLRLPPAGRLAVALAGIAGYVAFARLAVLAWEPDIENLWRWRAPEKETEEAADRTASGRITLLIGVPLLTAALAAPARAQQTIFNVPSADVLAAGHAYFEADELWRPADPRFSVSTIRGVAGLGDGVEAGLDVGGFVSPGRSAPTATAAVKWQPLSSGGFTFTTGAQGLFYLRGAPDGSPSFFGYAHAAYRVAPTQTRITAGAWTASPGYADAKPRGGALAGFEQPLTTTVALAADWFSGRNGLGYWTPGAVVSLGRWTAYAGYSVKNADSRGNALLIELGLTH